MYDTNEFLQLQEIAVSQKDEDSKKWALESFSELAENIHRLHLTLGSLRLYKQFPTPKPKSHLKPYPRPPSAGKANRWALVEKI
jgi:hypothetical protein